MNDISLTPEQRRRAYLLDQLLQGQLSLEQAAQHLGLSRRQVLRLKATFHQEGATALIHKSRGHTPHNATAQEYKDQIILLSQRDYRGASYAHLSELLAEHQQITVSAKTVGRILTQAGLGHAPAPKCPRLHKSRERHPQEGLLVHRCAGAPQMDASAHAWLEDRGPLLSLHGAIEDATSKILGLHFRLHEDTWGYLHTLWRLFMICRQISTSFGLPMSIYTDQHTRASTGYTLFFSPKKASLSIEEQLAGKQVALTQFGRVLEELHIRHIRASDVLARLCSPQAKGRVERLWGTLQERLPLEMRLAQIDTIEAANAFLPGFLQRHNARFAVPAADPNVAWRACPTSATLNNIVCLRHERKSIVLARHTSAGSTISFVGSTYRLMDGAERVIGLTRGSSIAVLEHLQGAHEPEAVKSALYEGKSYRLAVFVAPPGIVAPDTGVPPRTAHPPAPPSADHPWRKHW